MVNYAMPKDLNQIAANIAALTTGTKIKEEVAKNPAAVALGRLGGLKGGKARADKLTKRQRQMIAQKAAVARWGKKPA
jgi:hypothetical protein